MATMEENILSHLGRRYREELRVVTSLFKERLRMKPKEEKNVTEL